MMLIRCDVTKNPVGTDTEMVGRPCQCQACAAARRIAELEARLEAVVAGAILPADAVDEFTVDGVRWVRVPAEATVTFSRTTE